MKILRLIDTLFVVVTIMSDIYIHIYTHTFYLLLSYTNSNNLLDS